MKAFFGKKYVFLFCFLAGLFAFFGYGIYHGQKAFADFGKGLTEASGYEQAKELWGELRKELLEELEESAAGDLSVEVYGIAQRLMDKREYRNFSFVRGGNDMLYYGAVMANENDSLMEYAVRTGRAARCAGRQGAKTIFIMPPSKVLYGVMGEDRELPVNDPNAMQDELLLYMQQNQVATLDLRTALTESGMTHEEMFYRTDHSWTSEAAFIAAGALADKIRKDFGDDWDPEDYYLDRANYTADTYRQGTIGAIGRETGLAYAGKEDYTVLYPKFETHMKWYDLESGERKAGSFYDVFVDLESSRADAYSNPGSSIYLEGVVNQDRIVNEDNPEGPRVLCLRDSYMSPVACFLAPMCSQIDMVWARSDRNGLDYEEMIREGEYDYLFIEVYPYNVADRAFAYFENQGD